MKCPQLKMLMKKKISLKNKNKSSTSFTPKKRRSENWGCEMHKNAVKKAINQKSMHANRSMNCSISLLIQKQTDFIEVTVHITNFTQ